MVVDFFGKDVGSKKVVLMFLVLVCKVVECLGV